ncbi:MAG: type II toxin-antitoxin system VapC family toxin [Gemmatimonadaceae bacterium]
MGRSRVIARAAGAASVWRADDLAGYDGPLLLDTHIWIWYLEGAAAQMDRGIVPLLERVGAAGRLRVSDISYWEVAVKTATGKLELAIDAGIWLRRAEQAPGIQFHALDRQTLLLSTRLAGAAHNDPADRMLIATAQLNSIPLVTADGLIVDYARARPGTPVVDARVGKKG